YWLLSYNTTCPAGWIAQGSNCRFDSPATDVPVQNVANLGQLSLTGSANSGGTEAAILTTAAVAYTSNHGGLLNLASAWHGAEFSIVGDCCNFEATFNPGSTIVVRTTVHHGTTNAPDCVLEGYTGETNNLTLVGAPAVSTGPSPAIVFTQSNIPGTPASC